MPENAEGGPGLKVIRGWGSIAANTVGRINAIPTDVALLTPGAILSSPEKDTAEFLQERYKDVSWKGQVVEVYLGHSPLLRQLRRLFQKERRTNLLARVFLGIPTTLSAWAAGNVFRTDAYNPYTESAQVYHSNPAVAMHEAGHAEDFDQSKFPTLRAIFGGLPFFKQKLEWNASRNAMKHLKNEYERREAGKVLEPAFGSYLGLYMPFAPLSRLINFVPLIGGHIHSRISKNSIFGNFKDEEKKEEHQASAQNHAPAAAQEHRLQQAA